MVAVSRMAHRMVTSSLDGFAAMGTRVLGRRRTLRGVQQTARWLQYVQGHLDGLDYRLRGRHPAPDVGDGVLTARARSELGSVRRALGLPRIDVTVEDGVAVLHGSVADADEAAEVTTAVAHVSGVRDVDAHLHLRTAGDATRTSARHVHPAPSAQLRQLRTTAEAAGITTEQAAAALRVFLLRLPDGERDHVVGHLSADVLAAVDRVPVRREVLPIRDVDGLVAVVAATAGLDERTALHALEAMLFLLAELVPEEMADVAAVLPADLRELWFAASAADDA